MPAYYSFTFRSEFSVKNEAALICPKSPRRFELELQYIMTDNPELLIYSSDSGIDVIRAPDKAGFCGQFYDIFYVLIKIYFVTFN